MKETEIRRAVRDSYARVAKKKPCCCSQEGHIGSSNYSKEELETIPGEASEISAGCGNPIALGELKEGDAVLDLGSGGGMDVFLASKIVGAKGKVIGVDATPEMVWRTRDTARKNKIENVEFLLGEIEHLPVESASVDVVISNCVINLSPDKEKVFQEAFRVLKPGGRLAVSDIVLLERLPDIVKNFIPSWVGCLAGAALEEEYLEQIRGAGFTDVKVVARHLYGKGDIEAMILSEEEKVGGLTDELIQALLNVKAASAEIVAFKP